ncbi:MAG TPA: glycosyltransferase [Herpetosiphonaceae bacterium]
MRDDQLTAMHIISNLDTGGAQEVVRTLAAYLPEAGCCVVVCTFKDGSLRQSIEELGAAVEVLPRRRASVLNLPGFLRDMLSIRRALIALVAKHNVTIVQTHLLRVLDFLVLSLRLSFPQLLIFWTIHNYNFALRKDQLPRHRWLLGPKRLLYRLLYRLGSRWASGFVAVSGEVAPAIVQTIGTVQHKISVICNGVDVKRYTQPVDRSAIRRRLDLPADARLLIVVGTLKAQKGHRYLLEALPEVVAQCPDLHLLIVGDGELRADLAEQSRALGLDRHVHLLGNRGDVPALLAASDYFVLPSLWEGLPMALIEAMASGLPVIATEVSGTRQVMVPRETGLLVPPGDVDSLRAALLQLATNPDQARSMGAAARRRVIAAFSAQQQAAEHVALYRRERERTRHKRGVQAMPGQPIESVAAPPFRLTYIIGTYPSLTTTFIDREILAARRSGVDVRILSIRRSSGRLSAEQERLREDVVYLLPVAWLSFIAGHLRFALLHAWTYWSTLLYLLTRPHPSLRARLMTLLHFAEGGYAAHLLRRSPGDQLHAHFVDRAATVALVASRLLGVPYSVTAHANDIYVNPVLLPEKLGAASSVITCTGYNQAHLAKLGAGHFDSKVSCIYHGLDLSHYQPGNGAQSGTPLLLSVGQLKEKKGLTYLIDACQLLHQRGYVFECQIVGEGPLRAQLEAQIRESGLADVVRLCGALPHVEVIDKFAQASMFVLPCVLGANGDRDGIPNALLEAMAMQLPVVSTAISGIPEVVVDGTNGLLVPPADAEALATALARLLDDAEFRHELGLQGRRTVTEQFDVEWNVRRMLVACADGSPVAAQWKDAPVCQ